MTLSRRSLTLALAAATIYGLGSHDGGAEPTPRTIATTPVAPALPRAQTIVSVGGAF